MKLSNFSLLLASFCLLLAPHAAHAAPSQIAQALGNLRWGMSELEAKNALKGKASNVSRVEFDGSRNRYDGSVIGEEYTHGNDESMLTFKDKDAENYLFFIGGELWKWVKVYPTSSFKGGLSAAVKKKFGKGYDKNGEVNPGSGAVYSYTEYMDRDTRLRAVDKSAEAQRYVLMFESLGTARSLASLRSNTIRRGSPPKKSSAVASKHKSDDDEDEGDSVASRAPSPVSAPGTLASKGKNKKSILGDEQHEETAEEYNARKNKMQADARNQQQRMHQRGEEAKKGKILDQLAGIDDDDPTSGMDEN